MTTITIKAGQKPTEEQLKEVDAASRRPIQFDPDCQPSSSRDLAEFAAMARELRRAKKKTKTAVTIRLDPECLDTYKAFGHGYTTVMADVLAYAAKNPEVLSQIGA